MGNKKPLPPEAMLFTWPFKIWSFVVMIPSSITLMWENDPVGFYVGLIMFILMAYWVAGYVEYLRKKHNTKENVE
jgi:hypothetical protein